MFGLQKTVIKGRKTRGVVRFEGFSLQKEGRSLQIRSALNCDFRGGGLKRGIGLAPFRTAAGKLLFMSYTGEVQGVYPVAENNGWEENRQRVYIAGDDGYLYLVNPSTRECTQLCFLGSHVAYRAIKGNDKRICHLFAGDSGACGGVEEVAPIASGIVTGLAVCKGRCFLGKASGHILYSSPFLPTEFDGPFESGELYLPPKSGEIVGLATAEEELYIFVEKGVFRLHVTGAPREFYLEPLVYVGGRICPRSMVELGEKIFFLAEDGAWSVQGKHIQRVCEHLPISPNAKHTCRVGKCEDVAMVDYAEGEEYRRVALYADGKEGYFMERYGELGGNEFCALASMGYTYQKSGSALLYQNAPKAYSVELTLGKKGNKYLKAFSMTGSGSVLMRLESEGVVREYSVEFVDGRAAGRLQERGKTFRLQLLPKDGGRVDSLTLEYDCMEVDA